MKKMKKELWILGIVTCTIAIACSVSDNGDNPPNSPTTQTKDAFLANVVGTYTASTTASLTYNGETMDFSQSTVRVTVSDFENNLHFNTYINGTQAPSTLYTIFADEGSDFNGNMQGVIYVTSTNSILENAAMYATNSTTFENMTLSLAFNPDTQELSLDGTVIGTKNP